MAEEVRIRIDGEPAPHGFLSAIVSEKPGNQFFYNKHWLMKYNSASKTKRLGVPVHSYFAKIEQFFQSHYERGELYMEYLKGDCLKSEGELCSSCLVEGG